MQKFTIQFRDQFAKSRSINIWALDESDAIQSIERDGYGRADEMTLFPLSIEKVERVAA